LTFANNPLTGYFAEVLFMNDSFSKSLLKVYLKGAAFGGIIILLLYTAAAVFLTFKDLSDPVLNFLSLLICGAGGFCTAYKIGRT